MAVGKVYQGCKGEDVEQGQHCTVHLCSKGLLSLESKFAAPPWAEGAWGEVCVCVTAVILDYVSVRLENLHQKITVFHVLAPKIIREEPLSCFMTPMPMSEQLV